MPRIENDLNQKYIDQFMITPDMVYMNINYTHVYLINFSRYLFLFFSFSTKIKTVFVHHYILLPFLINYNPRDELGNFFENPYLLLTPLVFRFPQGSNYFLSEYTYNISLVVSWRTILIIILSYYLKMIYFLFRFLDLFLPQEGGVKHFLSTVQ